MADTVQYLLEEAIPELEAYERKGYFSKAELKQIIQKRQDFEYRLKRRAALKEDFYRYIEYETKLEELRRHRKKKLGIKGKKSIADTAIIKRIHFIHERASRKFKSDLQLWLDWLGYCKKTKASKQHSKVVTKALQRHATATVLWIEAATWEFEHSGNVAAARSLMQQGLRVCKHEEVMWVEYLRMELLYIQRLRVRREVLGLDVPGEGSGAAKPGTAMDDGAAAAAAPASAGDQAGARDEAEAAATAVLSGAVARIVYKNAIAAIPGSLALRKKVLEVLALFDFPGIRELEDHVYDTVSQDFPLNEAAWELLARRPLVAAAACFARQRRRSVVAAADAGEGHQAEPVASSSGRTLEEAELGAHAEVVETYQRAVQAVQTDRMYDLYAQYLESRLGRLMSAAAAGGADAAPSTSGRGQQPSQRGRKGQKRGRDDEPQPAVQSVDAVATAGAELLGAYLAAHKSNCAPASLYLRWVQWAQRLGQPKMALGAARQACERHPAQSELWACRLAMEVQPSELLKTFQAAISAVALKDSADLWLLVLQTIGPKSADFSRLVELLVTAVAGATAGPIMGGLGHVVAAFMEQIRSEQGVEAARTFYRRFLTLPAAGCEFFYAAIALEQAEEAVHSTSTSVQAGKGRAISRGQSARESPVRQLFEAAVACYGAVNPELWLKYAQYEAASLRGAGDIYWRATKALDDPDPFVISFREMQGTDGF